MNILLLIGVLIGFGGVVGGYMIDGGSLVSLLRPSSAAIVFGGTIGIALIAFPFNNIKKIPSALKLIMFHKKHNYEKLVDLLCDIANKARKDGLLSLEAEADKQSDPFMKKGLGYIADGVDPEFLKKVLYNEIESQQRKYEAAAAVFEGMGGTAPTMGVLGTVMGMVTILKHMGSDTNTLAKEIATAFIATMYGVGSANLMWLPLGSHIKVVSEEETEFREIIVEGFLAIQAGEPSARLRDRLFARIGEKQSGNTERKSDSAES